jgi:hypothetical protein
MKQQIANLSREKAESEQKLDNAVDILKEQLKFTERGKSEDFETWITRNFKKNEESLHKLQELIAKDGRMVNSVFIDSFLTKLQDGSLKKMTQTVRANEAYIQVQNRNYNEINFFRGNVIGEQQLQDEKNAKRFLEVVVQVYGEDTSHPIMTYTYKGDGRPRLAVKSSDETDFASQVWLRRKQNNPQPVSSAEKPKHSSSQEKNSLLDIKINYISIDLRKQVEEAVRALPLTTWDEEKGLLSLDSSEWIRTQCLQKMNNNKNLYYDGALFEDKFFNPKILFFDDKQFEKLIKEVDTVLSEKKNITEIDFHGLHVDIPSFYSTWQELVEQNKTYGRNPLYYPFEKVTDQKYLKTASDSDFDADKKTKLQEIKGLATETAQWPGENIALDIGKKWEKLVEVLVPKNESKHVSKKFNLVTLDLSNTNIDEKLFNDIVEANHKTLHVIKCDNVLRTIPLNLSIIAKCRNLSTLHCNYYLNIDNKETFYNTEMITSPFEGLLTAQTSIKVFLSNLEELSANWVTFNNANTFLKNIALVYNEDGKSWTYKNNLKLLNGNKVVETKNDSGEIAGYRLESAEQVQVPSGAAAKKVCSRCGCPKRAPSSH